MAAALIAAMAFMGAVEEEAEAALRDTSISSSLSGHLCDVPWVSPPSFLHSSMGLGDSDAKPVPTDIDASTGSPSPSVRGRGLPRASRSADEEPFR